MPSHPSDGNRMEKRQESVDEKRNEKERFGVNLLWKSK